jgi:hypothetical protein
MKKIVASILMIVSTVQAQEIMTGNSNIPLQPRRIIFETGGEGYIGKAAIVLKVIDGQTMMVQCGRYIIQLTGVSSKVTPYIASIDSKNKSRLNQIAGKPYAVGTILRLLQTDVDGTPTLSLQPVIVNINGQDTVTQWRNMVYPLIFKCTGTTDYEGETAYMLTQQ